MEWTFFIIFVILSFATLFIIKMKKVKILLFYGIGIVAIPIFFLLISVLGMHFFKLIGKVEIMQNLGVFIITLTISSMTFCLLNLFNLLPTVMINFILGFHERYNSTNMNKNPIVFFVNNKLIIQSIYSFLIFKGSILVFYGIWFELKF